MNFKVNYPFNIVYLSVIIYGLKIISGQNFNIGASLLYESLQYEIVGINWKSKVDY